MIYEINAHLKTKRRRKIMKKKIISVLLASMMVIGLVGCGGSKDTADGAKSDSGDGLIKVGIINNDPNESGYRTANDKDLKATFTKENGYDASFAYSLKNDEQITSAQKFIQDGVDYLLLSAADTAGQCPERRSGRRYTGYSVRPYN